MKVLTCNIRCSVAEDGEDNWRFRKDFCAETIRAQSPDMICFQEMLADQFADLKAALPDFTHYAMIDDPCGENPTNAIFYREVAFTVLSAGGYWLSETPHIAGSKSWNSSCVRLANWMRLEEKASGKSFRVVNTHLDHMSQPARERQAQCIVEDAAAYPEDFAQILTGDMNCDLENEAIKCFLAGGWLDSYAVVHGPLDPGHTFHQFLGPQCDSPIGKMDWVFTRGAVTTRDAAVIMDARDGRYPSDHYFVSAELVL